MIIAPKGLIFFQLPLIFCLFLNISIFPGLDQRPFKNHCAGCQFISHTDTDYGMVVVLYEYVCGIN